MPKVLPPSPDLHFSDAPTVEEIFRARVFNEPLVPLGGEPSADENADLSKTLLTLYRQEKSAWPGTVREFLRTHPDSFWRASLLANVGVIYAQEHAYSRALETWDTAWNLTKDLQDARGRAVADTALSEWLTLAVSFGGVAQVKARLDTVRDRSMRGTAGVRLAIARETARLLEQHPDQAVPCAREALLALLAERKGANAKAPNVLMSYRATAEGTSLLELQRLSDEAGLRMQIAAHAGAEVIPTPSVVHLKIGHYVTITERQGDQYRVVDRTRSATYWVAREDLLAESSGHFLIPSNASVDGWRPVDSEEAIDVRGFGPECPPTAPPAPPNPPQPPDGCQGMARYVFQKVTASLLIYDTPASYRPPRGPAVDLTISYHQREWLQQQIPTIANMGPKWTFNWLRYLKEEPTDALGVTPPHVWILLPPGGREAYAYPDAQGVYPSHWNSRASLVRVSNDPVRYERRLPDGTVEVYGLSDGAPAGQRLVFLTELIDAQGQELQFTWDAEGRLLAITDAVGQVSTVEYALASDSLKVTAIVDPFGRRATFTYNGAGQLASITDVIGLTSAFAYGNDDFVTTLTTPYGVTSFRHEPNQYDISNFRFIEATDPLGGTEHVEFQWSTPELPASVPANEVPTGLEAWNAYLDQYNTFYWSKRAWAAGAGDLSKAEVTHWLVGPEFQGWQEYTFVPHSVKKPLESRVWYAYPGQTAGRETVMGSWREPSRIGRVLDDGTSQITDITYNDQGKVLTRTDPLGRQTSYTYAANGIDLLTVRNTTGALNDLLTSYGTYSAQHQPDTATDAAGQTTTYTYNAAGQVLTVTNPKQETTTSAYDTNGYLQAVTGPITGATVGYTYDAFGRIRTITGPDGYAVSLDYDALNRQTKTTYPDGTYDEIGYDRLRPGTLRDRLGRITRIYYDAAQRVTAVRDPLGRLTRFEWCGCGSLSGLVDAKGQRTTWERDLEGRATREVRADGVTDTLYAYDGIDRLVSVTDPKRQVKILSYLMDDALGSLTYTNTTIATPAVTFTYDSAYPRVATMVDGLGTTTYAYKPAGQLGAGSVASIDGPRENDTLTYGYDELRRVVGRVLNGVGVSWGFDALGRVTSESNTLGSFAYTYDEATSRLASATYPNAQTSLYSYFPNTGDARLQTIHHKTPLGTTLSKFDYTYDVVGNILTWGQQADAAAPTAWTFGYDAADQLVAAVRRATDPEQTVLVRYGYQYDLAANRTTEQVDDVVTGATHDALNRLLTHTAAGSLRMAGTVSEPATVMINSAPAIVDAANHFSGVQPIVSGTNTFAVTATDMSGNSHTNTYEVDAVGENRTFTSDANGNLTADGTRTFEWDGENRLAAINIGTYRSEFTYDGNDRRVRIVEKENGSIVRDAQLFWAGAEIIEERLSTGEVNRFFDDGEQLNGAARYLTRDHLGSIREVTDQDGNVVTRNEYDPYGRTSRVAGTEDSRFGFTGHYVHQPSGLLLALYRAYDPMLGRWISEDPLGLTGGANLHEYVSGEPIRYVDPLGLKVRNGSGSPVIVKPEEGPPGVVPPNSTYPGKIDGVKGADDKWTKFYGKDWLPDNDVEVTPDGKVKCVGGLCKLLPPKKLDRDPDEGWKVPKNPKELPGCKRN